MIMEDNSYEEETAKMNNDTDEQITEEDIKQATEESMPVRERLFGEVAINIAEDIQIFGGPVPATVAMRPTAIATCDNLVQYAQWEEEIRSITRNEPQWAMLTKLAALPQLLAVKGKYSQKCKNLKVLTHHIQVHHST